MQKKARCSESLERHVFDTQRCNDVQHLNSKDDLQDAPLNNMIEWKSWNKR